MNPNTDLKEISEGEFDALHEKHEPAFVSCTSTDLIEVCDWGFEWDNPTVIRTLTNKALSQTTFLVSIEYQP